MLQPCSTWLPTSTADTKERKRISSQPEEQSPVHDFATVRMNKLPRNVRTVVGGQKEIGRRHLCRLTRPCHRHVASELFHLVGFESRGDQGRPDGARRYTIHADVALDEVRRQTPRE